MAVYQKAFPFVARKTGVVLTVIGFSSLYLTIEHPDQLILLSGMPWDMFYAFVGVIGITMLGETYAEKKVKSYFFKLPNFPMQLNLLTKPSGLFEKLKRHIKGGLARDDAFLIGKGFLWRQRHVQMIYDLDLDADIKEEIEQATEDIDGIPLYHAVGADEEKRVYLPLNRLPGHVGIEGTTRVGKSRWLENVFSQQILRKDGAGVCIDPKGDLKMADVFYEACAMSGNPKRFKMFSLVHKLDTINPLLRYDEPSDVANRLVRMIQPEEGKTDSFINFALGELVTVCEALDYLQIPMSIKVIYDFLTIEEVKKDYLNRLSLTAAKDGSERGKKNVKALQRVLDHPSDHYKKLIITITPILESLSTGAMEELLCSTEPTFEFHRDMKEDTVVLFSLASQINKTRADQVARLILEDFVSYIGRVYAYETPDKFRNIYAHFDEVGDYLSPALVNFLNKAGGSGLKAHCYFQTEEDWVVALGSKDAALKGLGNLNTRVWLRTLSSMGIQELVNNAPVTKVIMTQETTTRQARPDNADLLFSAGVNSRTTPEEVPILDGRMLKSLPPGQGFMQTGGKYYKLQFPLVADPKISYLKEKGLLRETEYGG